MRKQPKTYVWTCLKESQFKITRSSNNIDLTKELRIFFTIYQLLSENGLYRPSPILKTIILIVYSNTLTYLTDFLYKMRNSSNSYFLKVNQAWHWVDLVLCSPDQWWPDVFGKSCWSRWSGRRLRKNPQKMPMILSKHGNQLAAALAMMTCWLFDLSR